MLSPDPKEHPITSWTRELVTAQTPTWSMLPRGVCWIRQDGIGNLYVERADPAITIADRVVDECLAGNHHRAIEVDPFLGLIKIRAKNRTVVYRLVQHVPEFEVWVAQWVD